MKVFHQDRARRKGLAVGVLAASMLASVLGLAPTAHAEPYTIEVEGCDVDDLITAVEQANASAAVDIIVLDDKCKYEFENGYFDGAVFTNNALPVITDDLTIYGNKSKVEGDEGFRFMEIDNVDVTIRDLTIEDFELRVPADLGPGEAVGGAILNVGGDLTLYKSTVKDNEVTLLNIGGGGGGASGGGIISDGGSVTLSRSTVSGNEVNLINVLAGADIAAAGGVGIAGGDGLTVSSSTVKGNKVNAVGVAASALVGGGGMVVTEGGELTMDKSTVSKNAVSAKSSSLGLAVAEAGGIYLGETGFTHEIARSTVSSNRASAKGGAANVAIGGGIVNTNEAGGGVAGLLVDEDDAPGFADIGNVDDDDKSTISYNTATCDGACLAAGGGYANVDLLEGTGNQGDAEFNRTVFKGNVADGDDGIGVGGGLAIIGDEAGAPELVLEDAKVTKNKAKGDAFSRGGGIFADDPANVDLNESDVYKNKPDDCWALSVGDFCDFS